MSVNKVILIGRLGADPEIRYTLDGKPVASFRIATNEVIVRNGEKETLTEWHRIVAFGRLAEICGELLTKGSQVYIEGKLRTRKFEDRQGIQRYITEVVVQNLQILDKKGTSSVSQSISQGGEVSAETSFKKETISEEPFEKEIDDEDIPF
jgi:single-strand DNA-binding protein